MSMKYVKRIPTVPEILEQMPLSAHLAGIKERRDREIRDVFENRDSRFLLVVGPCSADHEDSVLEYIGRLARMQEKVKSVNLIIPRIYTNKPRTTGEGYKGMVHQPDPNRETDLCRGVKAIRELHIRVLGEYHMPAADEMLYPENFSYLADVLAYHTVGARSVENQQHRLTASGVDSPVGMKNPTSGDHTVMLNSIHAAQTGHTFIYNGWQVETSGNPYAHAVLRGAVDANGRHVPNYHYEDLIGFCQAYEQKKLTNPAVIVDTNHSNSMKRPGEQPRIALEVMASRKYEPLLTRMIKGLMIESYLVGGRQEIGGNVYGQSITDPCLGWEDTERLIGRIAESV